GRGARRPGRRQSPGAADPARRGGGRRRLAMPARERRGERRRPAGGRRRGVSAVEPLPDRLGGAPDGKRRLRLWLRLLTCATAVEQRLAQRLREDFGATLPRFDFLSALERAGEAGLTLGEVSRRLMVTQGNVTGLTARLKAEGLIEPVESPDRRVQRVRL